MRCCGRCSIADRYVGKMSPNITDALEPPVVGNLRDLSHDLPPPMVANCGDDHVLLRGRRWSNAVAIASSRSWRVTVFAGIISSPSLWLCLRAALNRYRMMVTIGGSPPCRGCRFVMRGWGGHHPHEQAQREGAGRRRANWTWERLAVAASVEPSWRAGAYRFRRPGCRRCGRAT